MKKIILLIVLIFSNTSYPIQRSTADICTAVIAATCASGSLKIWSETHKIHPAILVGVSCVITAAMYHWLHQSTPAGRIKRANILLDDVARHTLARVSFDDEESFFDAVQDMYLTDDLPLMSAYNHLINL